MRHQLIDIFLPKTLYRPKLPISHFQNFLPKSRCGQVKQNYIGMNARDFDTNIEHNKDIIVLSVEHWLKQLLIFPQEFPVA